jgi:hypothetical protein
LEYRISVPDDDCDGFCDGIGDAMLLTFVKKRRSQGYSTFVVSRSISCEMTPLSTACPESYLFASMPSANWNTTHLRSGRPFLVSQ